MYNIKHLFPISLYNNKLPNKFIKDFKFIDKEKHKDMPGNDLEKWGSRSLNSYVLDNVQLLDLKKYILDCCSYYGYEILGFDCKDYKITQSWVSYKNPNSKHTPHMHFNSIISGVIFYGQVEKETPGLTFYDNQPMIRGIYRLEVPYRTDKIIESNSKEITLNFNPGTIVLFPSWLPHSVPKNKSSIIRKSLAFNVIPKNNLGLEETLTELKY